MKHTIFLLLVFTIVASTYADYSISYNALQTGRFRESNPLTASFVMRPGIAIPIITITGGATAFGLDHLYRSRGTQTVSWVIIGLLFTIKAFVLIHNIHTIH